MRLRGKLVGQLTAEDIRSLIDDEVMESRTLDYKKQFTDDSKELLADILSFANTDGGVLIYGIEEKIEAGRNTAMPASITGLPNVSLDQTRQKIENTLRDNVDPRVPSVAILGLKNVLIGGEPVTPLGPTPIAGKFEDTDILLPGIILDSLMKPQEIAESLRGMLNMLWQAAGRAKSPHYKSDGSWGLAIQ